MMRPCKFSKTAMDSSSDKGIITTTGEKDIISQLPEELLGTIISYLNLRDAVKTSLLSHAWKHICSSRSILEFDWVKMNQDVWKTHEHPCKTSQTKFVKGVSQFLRSYRGREVSSFAISCCLGHEWTNAIDYWVRFAVAKGTAELYLHLYCEKLCCRDDIDIYGRQIEGKYVLRSELFEGVKINLKKLWLIRCSLGPNFTNQLRRLEDLCFEFSPLSKYDLQSLLSRLVKLKVLLFTSCRLPKILCVSPLPLLEEFMVLNCTGLRKIELSNENLLTFKCVSPGRMYEFDLRGAPNLREFSCYVVKSKLQYFFTHLPDQLPMLSSLQVVAYSNWVALIPETISTFSHVTKLSLLFLRHPTFAIMKIISILKAFPNLCALQLSTWCSEDFDQENLKLGEYVPKYLTEVEIGGFYSTPNQMEFAIYLLKNACALKRLVINPEVKHCEWILRRQSWDKGERQMVNERLQEFAKDGVLVVE